MRQLRHCSFLVGLFCIVGAAAAQPQTGAINDHELTSKVEAALASDRSIKARDIDVETRDSVVQLSGFVDSENERTAVVMRARSVSGVAEVRDDLSIRNDDRPAKEPVSDTVIAARVRDSLGNVKLAKDSDVNVEVSKGVVQLSGFVNTAEEKARAGDAASAVAGVRDVENHIALTAENEKVPKQ
ncbi:BON domain-containing protein [Steroidobacter sp.]|uniref:BON domain-containing protein n=1 Tax=Steroidobacter sp. TaxID=1978227 RepID=UPI001A5765D2|nr:BON domain-containing protein [Steroidobacter sp.]MBL8270758.1 BON domain-containing protein [Steroidobacter sp.]